VESLFRFILSRPAQRVDPSSTTVPLQPSADYQQQLTAAKNAEQAIPALRRLASAYRKGPRQLESGRVRQYSIPTGRASPSSEGRSICDCAKRQGRTARR
jgi:hypothetical protein